MNTQPDPMVVSMVLEKEKVTGKLYIRIILHWLKRITLSYYIFNIKPRQVAGFFVSIPPD
jgi:hypothetical protein